FIRILNYTTDGGLFGARFSVFWYRKGAAAPVDYSSTFATPPFYHRRQYDAVGSRIQEGVQKYPS
ncbi:hypothetical protein LK536_18940, partial [Lachnoclostridium pacaense]|uniref:hypothetical protein n=1 Tax=Enterocloster hominis (ex Hitch et al. 2024) TaxID=1917870 RepID=UPI001D0FE8DA